jgi:HEAT repeat protein
MPGCDRFDSEASRTEDNGPWRRRGQAPVDRVGRNPFRPCRRRAAEDAVLAMLADKDANVFDAACKVLAEIGGPKAIAALRQSAKTDGRARNSAKSALEKLQKKR